MERLKVDIKLTIFTPTYNRANTLPRLYHSLKNQTVKNFEWLIVDDGSTDNTYEIVKGFINEKVINIRYFKQKNQGKQAAWNFAVSNCMTDLFCGVDSDDRLYNNKVIELILEKFYLILMSKREVIGLRALTVSSKTLAPSGKEISQEDTYHSYFTELSDKKLIGERIDVFKTVLIKNYLFPVEQDIKFIPELWFYINTAKDGYLFLYVSQKIGFFYDETDQNRLTRSSIYHHAKGHYIAKSILLKFTPLFIIWWKNPFLGIKTLIRFSQVARISKKKFIVRAKDTNIVYALLSYPLSLITLGLN